MRPRDTVRDSAHWRAVVSPGPSLLFQAMCGLGGLAVAIGFQAVVLAIVGCLS